MSSSYRDAVPVAELYRSWGLDPGVFKADEARKEERLADVVLQPSWFFDVLGNVHDKDFLIVVGVRGSGKSALRRLIANYCASPISSEKLLEGNVLCISIDHDVPSWARRAKKTGRPLEEFCEEVAELLAAGIALRLDPELARMKLTESQLALLARFVGRFNQRRPEEAERLLKSTQTRLKRVYKAAKELEALQDIVSIAIKENVQELTRRDLTQDIGYPDEAMEQLANIAKELGYDIVYVLVDEIDEYAEVGSDPRLAAELLAPIITSLRLLEIKGVAFKFFLSEPVFGHLGQVCEESSLEIRWDRTSHSSPFILAWRREEIAQMLERRLRVYSTGEKVTSLRKFCAQDFSEDIDSQIVHFAYRSPRYFIKCAHRIAVEAARAAGSTSFLITKSLFENAVKDFCLTTVRELYQQPYLDGILSVGKMKFEEVDVLSILSKKGIDPQLMLSDLMARGALKRSEEGIGYEVLDSRLRFLLERGVRRSGFSVIGDGAK